MHAHKLDYHHHTLYTTWSSIFFCLNRVVPILAFVLLYFAIIFIFLLPLSVRAPLSVVSLRAYVELKYFLFSACIHYFSTNGVWHL